MNNAIPSLRIMPADISPAAAQLTPSRGEGGFLETLQNAMQQIGDAQSQADTKVADLLSGRGTEIHEAMIAVEKANLSFQLMLEVRNKIVSAYQEVSRMQF